MLIYGATKSTLMKRTIPWFSLTLRQKCIGSKKKYVENVYKKDTASFPRTCNRFLFFNLALNLNSCGIMDNLGIYTSPSGIFM